MPGVPKVERPTFTAASGDEYGLNRRSATNQASLVVLNE